MITVVSGLPRSGTSLLMDDPGGESEHIRDFLDLPLDAPVMARQVQPALYRQRLCPTV